MSPVTSTEEQLSQIVGEIASAKLAISNIRRERRRRKAVWRGISNELAYYRFLEWVRSPGKRYRWYSDVSIATVPFGVSVLLLVVGIAMKASGAFIIFGVPAVFAALFSITFVVLRRPPDSELPTIILDAEERKQVAAEDMAVGTVTDGLVACENRLRELEHHRKHLAHQVALDIASGKRRRMELLLRNWKSMRGYQWENYLVEVCAALGARAERIGGAGDQGVDLIVRFGANCIAVQAKGYFNSVNNKAVQEAYSGMAHHECTGCAVITNSRFTPGAIELAASTGCILISEDEFPDFVMGNKRIWLDLMEMHK